MPEERGIGSVDDTAVTGGENSERGPVPLDDEGFRTDAHAVIVGINSYQDPGIPDLQCARADAEAMHAVLTDPELGRFHPDNVALLLDEQATRQEVVSAIAVDLPKKASPDDTVVVYFAGHGAPVIDQANRSSDGFEKYLIPHDGQIEGLRATAIMMDRIQEYFGYLSASKVLFFLDACYSGSGGGRSFELPGFSTRGSLSEEFLDSLGSEGRVVVSACGPNEVSLERSELGHGLFTHHLTEGLRGAADSTGDGLVSIDELYAYVYEKVESSAREMSGSMHPVRKGSVSGKLNLTQYATQEQKQARKLGEEGSAALASGDRKAAEDLWRQALDLDPKAEAARLGLDSIERAQAEREKQVKARQRQLLKHRRDGDMPTGEYERGMSLLERDPDSLSPGEREVHQALEDLTTGVITLPTYITTVDLLESDEGDVNDATGGSQSSAGGAESPAASASKPSAAQPAPAKSERAAPVDSAPAGGGPGLLKRKPLVAAVAVIGALALAWLVIGLIGSDDEPVAPPTDQAVELEIGSNVTGDTVFLDGRERGGPTPINLLLEPGDHIVEIRREGCESASQELTIVAGATPEPLKLSLTCASAAPRPAAATGNPRILVSGGEFLMGSPPGVGDKDEHPQRTVTVSSFRMQKYEVTNEEYRLFDPEHEFDPGDEDLPAVVNWTDGQRYAQSLDGGSLPTEAQWEFAARGSEGRIYPWGNDPPDCQRANYEDCGGVIKPVGDHPAGATPEGIQDLAGNLSEWCADGYARSYPSEDQTDPLIENSNKVKVRRGGSFKTDLSSLRGTDRSTAPPMLKGAGRGFRVVWPVNN